MTTPTIAQVTGLVQTGQTLTISGANMVDHDTTNWDASLTESEASFEGASLAADGWTATTGAQVTDQKILGSKAFKNTFSGAVTFPAQHVGRLYHNDWTLTPPFWIRAYYRADTITTGNGSWPDNYHKLGAYYAAGGGAASIFWNWLGTGSTPTRFIIIHNNSSQTITGSVVPFQEKRWHCLEVKYPSSALLAVEIWFDGVRCLNDSVALGHDRAATFLEFDENQGDTGAGYGAQYWWDGIVCSSSRVRPASVIEIGNTSNYATASPKYQEPLLLSNTSNQIKADLTGLGAGPYWMWVTNNRNERSAAFSLSGGGGPTFFARHIRPN